MSLQLQVYLVLLLLLQLRLQLGANSKDTQPASTCDILLELYQGIQGQTLAIFGHSHFRHTTVYAEIVTCRVYEYVPKLLVDNSTALRHLQVQHNAQVLFIMPADWATVDTFRALNHTQQTADFLFIATNETEAEMAQDVRRVRAKWRPLFVQFRQLGYCRILLSLSAQQLTTLYAMRALPLADVMVSTVNAYLAQRNAWHDLQGLRVLVAVGNNPPTALVYRNAQGQLQYKGYYLNFLQEFLRVRNGIFVTVLMPNYNKTYSLLDCIVAVRSERVDLCGDAATYHPYIDISNPTSVAQANVIAPNDKPLLKFYYFLAPFKIKAWLSLIVYILAVTAFVSCVHWCQQQRWQVGKFLLKTLSSLICNDFQLNELHGALRYILYMSLFLTGFILSTYYLAVLNSILATDVYEPPIENFEDLRTRNIRILISLYDRSIIRRANIDENLMSLTKVVTMDTLRAHRNHLDSKYAYAALVDRLDMHDYQQKFLIRPRMRRIPINVHLAHVGFPMRPTWFLKRPFEMSILHGFEGGLNARLLRDATAESMRHNYNITFLPTKYYTVTAMGLDYFEMPAILLGIGYALAFLSFICEFYLHTTTNTFV